VTEKNYMVTVKLVFYFNNEIV